MIFNANRIIVLAPHTDDGELGCGGTIARLIEQGHNVFYVTFSTATESLPPGVAGDTLKREVTQATAMLGIDSQNTIIFDYEVRKLNYVRQSLLEELVGLKKRIQPDLVFMPSLHDIHQDHLTVAQEALRAFKDNTILGYELIWNNLSFNTQCFFKLEEKHIQLKIDSLLKYKSQESKPYMTPEIIKALAYARGVQIGAKYAECFEVIRWVI